jgi:hypothetical protein
MAMPRNRGQLTPDLRGALILLLRKCHDRSDVACSKSSNPNKTLEMAGWLNNVVFCSACMKIEFLVTGPVSQFGGNLERFF